MTGPESAENTRGYVGAADSSHRQIDATGLLCPLPVLRLTKALRDAAPGTRVELLATDPASAIDVPHFCGQAGHVLETQETRDDGVFRYVVVAGGRNGA